MQQSKQSLRSWFLIKFLITTIVFYIGFSYNTQKTLPSIQYTIESDKSVSIATTELWFSAQTGIEKEIDALLQQLFDPIHEVWDIVPQDRYAQRFQVICQAYINICNTMLFVGDFSSYEQLIYLVWAVRIIHHTNNFLLEAGQGSLIDALDRIQIHQTWGTRRWGATRNTIVLYTEHMRSYAEFFEVLTHEVWHIVDLGVLQWTNNQVDQNYTEFGRAVFYTDDISLEYYRLSRSNERTRLSWSQPQDFCSWYGMTNPFEDFAECFNLYMNHHTYFRHIAKQNTILAQKYNFLAAILNDAYLFSAPSDMQRLSSRTDNWRPRDTTRMR